MTEPRTRRGSALSVARFEMSKLAAQKRTWITLLVAVVVPFIVVPVLQHQARPPKDTLLGRFVHDSGWSVPLLLLGFAGQWLLPLLAAIVAGDIFASEDQHGSWKTILTRSVSRTQLFVGKALVAIGFSVLTYVVLAASTILASVLIVGSQPLVGLTGQLIGSHDAARLVIESWVAVGAPVIGFTGEAMLLSVWSRNIAVGIAAPVGLGLLMQLAGSVGGVDLIRPLLLTTPLETWHGLLTVPSFTGPLQFGIAVSAVWSIVSIATAYVVFRRRDYLG
jgi:ABC-2 type transport system permease protein